MRNFVDGQARLASMVNARILNKFYVRSVSTWRVCWGSDSATTTPNSSFMFVNLSELKPLICLLRSINCSGHLEKARLQKIISHK